MLLIFKSITRGEMIFRSSAMAMRVYSGIKAILLAFVSQGAGLFLFLSKHLSDQVDGGRDQDTEKPITLISHQQVFLLSVGRSLVRQGLNVSGLPLHFAKLSARKGV